MTLAGGLVVDFAKMFEPGQAYTALSRTTALDNVEIRNFDNTTLDYNRGMRANKDVLNFYKSLTPVDLLNLSDEVCTVSPTPRLALLHTPHHF
jgi:hypothetical protein